MKKLSIIFSVLAILLSDIMCAVVAYNYCALEWVESMKDGVHQQVQHCFWLSLTLSVLLFASFWQLYSKEKSE